ncbi:MAG: CheR family methyltransferase [Desulfovibrionales bacterium]
MGNDQDVSSSSSGSVNSPATTEGISPRPIDADLLHKQSFDTVLAMLREFSGVDFSFYKHSTIQRRMQRRMGLLKMEDYAEYAAFLQDNPGEVEALFDEILIKVTEFFRDPEVFALLQDSVYPAITRDKGPENPVRIWVPGCSTGEEVFSIAISLLEYLEDSGQNIPVLIFATDISEKALEIARACTYPESIADTVSADRLHKYFIKSDHHFRIRKHVRDMCVFARQNFIGDPPFSRLDMISCRNVLIYLGSQLQKKVMPIFHFALRDKGFLLLGGAESVGQFNDLFTVVDKKHKLYRQKAASERVRFELAPGRKAGTRRHAGETMESRGKRESDETLLSRKVNQILLSRSTPPLVVVNRSLDIIHFQGNTSPFLEPASGKASLNLMKMVRSGLKLELRTLIHEAEQTGAPVRKECAFCEFGRDTPGLTIEVIPMNLEDSSESCLLILFEEATLAAPPEQDDGDPAIPDASSWKIAKLRQELESARTYLQSLTEEKDRSNLELKAANEEILASNEELQSINEELETAKEELESSNEELTTVNQELETRNSELFTINSDLQNLFSSVEVPIIFVGPDLRIRRISPGAEKALSLTPEDRGRLITNVNLKLKIDDIQDILFQEHQVDRDVQDMAGRWYSLAVRPYRTVDNRKDGAIMVLFDITDRKQSERALRQSEERFRTVADFTHDMEYWIDPKGNLLYVSPSCERITGYDAETFLKDPRMLKAIIHPDDRKLYLDHLHDEENSREIYALDFRIITRTGEERWIGHVCRPVCGEDGRYLGRRGSNRDITTRKAAKERIQSLARFPSEDPNPVMRIAVTDGKILYANKSSEILLNHFNSNVGAVLPETYFKIVTRAYGFGKNQECEIRCDDQVFSLTISPILDAGYANIYGLDITKRKQAEEQLAKAEARYRSIFENAVEGLYQTTPDDRFLSANPAMARILGFDSPEDLIRNVQNISTDLYEHSADRDKLKSRIQSHEYVEHFETRMRRKDGSLVDVSLSARKVESDDRELFYEGSLVDITERKRAEEEKRLLEEQIRQAQKMEAVGILAGGIAHDFNNLLQAISGSIQLLLHRKDAHDPDFTQLTEVDRATGQAAELVRHLLTFSRKAPVRFTSVDINLMVEDALRLLKRTLPKMISLQTELDHHLPPTLADKTLLEQVILNLAGNARDAMEHEEGTISVNTACVHLGIEEADTYFDLPPGDYIKLTIADTGHGMDEETRSHIFEPFFTTKENGTGLGLSTVYGIVKSHGGNIWCESKPEKGTVFKILIPVRKADENALSRSVSESPEALKGRETILAVDDEAVLLNIVQDMLEHYGYTVLRAQSSEEGLKIYQEKQEEISLVIMDLGMPGMGGEAGLKEFLRMDQSVKVIVASGYSNHKISRNPKQFGAKAFLSKPYRLRTMLATVRSVLESG